ncbi:peptidoglycan bridge formation glycyltransferase FemA/FemB family protein [Erysipelotrichaceae bacterium RD49]|nr:peptidoglycan bridge formation glycyltransferase FemA/FemB family protein [Erysipelotrichaceae bacterium RD49]
MSKYEFKTEIPQAEFDAFASSHPLSNLLQSYNWSKIKSNWGSMHTGVYEDGKLVGTALVLIKQLPLGFSMFYAPRGPIMDYTNGELMKFYFNALKKEGRKQRALFVKMDPAIEIGKYPSYDKDRPHNGNENLVPSIEAAGAVHQGFVTELSQAIQARFSSILDKPDDILAAMPKKTRKLIKEADKRHLQIISGRNELLDDFAALVEMTESRKHVNLRNKDYFAHLIDTYKDDSIIMLAMCDPGKILTECRNKLSDLEKQIEALPENQKKKRFTLEEQKASALKDIHNIEEIIQEVGSDQPRPIAGVLTVKYGRSCEMLYAGMDERFRRFMPQYKTYVENFAWAFDKGCEEFSMGGVEGSLDDGLTHFKDNFAPLIHEYIGEFDLPVFGLLYKPAKMMYEKKRAQLKEA